MKEFLSVPYNKITLTKQIFDLMPAEEVVDLFVVTVCCKSLFYLPILFFVKIKST